MQGFLPLDKPAGLTSHDCVAKVRRLLKLKRVGHGGTLDPAATGVLPIALGKATRLLQYLRTDKAYRATLRLGVRTTTDDLEGNLLTAQPVPTLDLATVRKALTAFEGVIQQVPPHYSAVQVQGKRLYDLARSGQMNLEDLPAVAARTVEIYRIDVLDWRSGDFPELDVAIACGAGTYIRAIARDLGATLQVGGTLASLIRTESSGFSLHDSLTLDALETQVQEGQFQAIAPDAALAHLPQLVLPSEVAQKWCWGQKVAVPDGFEVTDTQGTPWRIHHEHGQFLGISQVLEVEAGRVLVPQMVYEPIS